MSSWASAEVAPEIDRLVLAVNEAVDGTRLTMTKESAWWSACGHRADSSVRPHGRGR